MSETTPQLDVTKTWAADPLPHDRILTCCAYSPDGRYLAAGEQGESVLLWDLEKGTKTVLKGHTSWVGAVAFHPSQPWLFSADYHGVIYCWPFQQENGQPLWTRPGKTGKMQTDWIRAMAVAADGNLLSAGNDGVVRLWSATDGQPLREFVGHEQPIFSLAVHPDGKSFVSGDLIGKVHLWDYATAKVLRTFDAGILHTRGEDFIADVGGARSLAFNKEGTLLACGGMTDITSNTFCPGKPAVLVFDAHDGALKQTLRTKQKSDGPINSVRFLADGKLAGHAEHLNGVSSLEFWQPDQTEPVHAIPRQSGYTLALHPDGLRLAVASFKINGQGGNGRNSDKETYTSHDGEIAFFNLFAKPA